MVDGRRQDVECHIPCEKGKVTPTGGGCLFSSFIIPSVPGPCATTASTTGLPFTILRLSPKPSSQPHTAQPIRFSASTSPKSWNHRARSSGLLRTGKTPNSPQYSGTWFLAPHSIPWRNRAASFSLFQRSLPYHSHHPLRRPARIPARPGAVSPPRGSTGRARRATPDGGVGPGRPLVREGEGIVAVEGIDDVPVRQQLELLQPVDAAPVRAGRDDGVPRCAPAGWRQPGGR